jgi:hypothetical protein
MNQRQAKFWVWWLLPLLAARALMPVGFMPQLLHGDFKLALCSGGFAKVTDTNPGVLDQNVPSHGDGESHASICPFAFSTGAALGHESIVSFAELTLTEAHNTLYQLRLFNAHPASLYRVRGPPVFS